MDWSLDAMERPMPMASIVLSLLAASASDED